MSEPNWVIRDVVDRVHDEQVRRDGNRLGILKESDLESAINRPKNAYHYDDERDIFILAAHYVFGLIQNHGYVDGNKRTALATAGAFLLDNGFELNVTQESIIEAMLSVSKKQMTISQLAELFRQHCITD